MFFCCKDTTICERVPESTYYYQFSSQQPLTRSKQQQLVPFDPQQPYSQFQGWQRAKVKLLNYHGIFQSIRERGLTNYSDQDFPQSSSSIGKNLQRMINWQRVGTLVKDPIYISELTLKEWNKFRCSNKSLQSALYVLRKHNPEVFQSLLRKSLIVEGIYEFRMMVRGILTNVIIDDYIPSSDRMPINAKPYRIREVFPMLIQKALAKAFGSYAKIPQNPLPLVEALACTPVLMWPLSNNVSMTQLLALKSRIDVESSSNCFIPRKGLEKMEHGLLEDELYMIMAVHEVLYSNKPIVLYEVINLENKGDWNGPFSAFDKNWSKVQPSQAATLKARVQTNDSMIIEESDVLRYFSLMGAIQKTEGCSQDWLTLELQKHHGQFVTIDVMAPNEKIYMKTWATEPSRQVLILARVLSNNALEFIAGNMVECSQENFLRAVVPVGVYALFMKVEPPTRSSSIVNLSVLSKLPLRLSESHKSKYPDFLPRLFSNMLSSLQLKPQVDNPYYSVYILYRKTGYAFLLFKPNRSIHSFFIDEQLLNHNGYKLRKPHAGRSPIRLINGPPTMLTFKMLNSSTFGSNIVFPEGSIRPAGGT